MDPIFVIAGLAVYTGVVFVGGIAWTRRQLKKNPEKVAALVAESKELRDRVRKALDNF